MSTTTKAKRTSPGAERHIKGASVTIRSVGKEFAGAAHRVHALNDISIDIAPGQFAVLLGPSGCGKTTLLRCIAGLESPTTGDIDLGGRTVYSASRSIDVPVEHRRIGMMFQSYALWPHMTVWANVAYALKIQRLSKEQIRTRVSDVLESMGLAQYASAHPSKLSGGQQQRVALARCLVTEPSIILFDEPLSNVDARVRDRLRAEITAIHERVGFTAIYVTHDQDEAMRLADRIVVMNKGGVEQDSSPRDVYDNPQSAYVTSFIGVTNRIDATYMGDGLFTTSAGMVSVAVIDQSLASGDTTVLSVRPHDIDLHDPAEGGAEGAHLHLSGVISSALYLGTHIEYEVLLGDGKTISVWSHRRRQYAAGEPVKLTIRREDVRAVPASHLSK